MQQLVVDLLQSQRQRPVAPHTICEMQHKLQNSTAWTAAGQQKQLTHNATVQHIMLA
jgi:hypothetical protein